MLCQSFDPTLKQLQAEMISVLLFVTAYIKALQDII